jgi:hypothetical protein
MKLIMFVKNLCTTRTWCYVDADLSIAREHSSVNFTLL